MGVRGQNQISIRRVLLNLSGMLGLTYLQKTRNLTSPNGLAPSQNMPRKDNLHGVRDHHRRIEQVWAPIITGLGFTDHRVSSNLGPLGQQLLTKGFEAIDTSLGLLQTRLLKPNPTKNIHLLLRVKKPSPRA